ncbi:MAG: hypothetical protein IPM54_17970 [Polyangiaceae bacterium]|nr:hypothetical protein [Polyangiaceae bacterium]
MAARTTKPKTTKTKTPKAAPEPVVIPPWPGISDDALQALAVKLDKAKDSYRVSDMILKVNGDEWGARHALAWHLVACCAIHPESNPSLFEFVAEQPDEPSPEVALDLLVRLPAASPRFFRDATSILDGYTLSIDRLLLATYQRAPDLVLQREKELNRSVRLGLSFLRRRLGETITAEASRSILEQLARHQATSYGITLNNELPLVENGELQEFRLSDLAALRRVALLFGTAKEWDDALLAAALEGKWQYPRNVKDAFLLASAFELARLVDRSDMDTGETLRTLVEVIPQREDDPQALFDAATTMDEGKMRDLVLMGVILRSGKTGAPLPDKIDAGFTFELLDTTYEGVREPVCEWFTHFPRERALSAARRLLEEDYFYARAAGILAAHFDEAILRAALEKDIGKNYIGHETLGGIGAPALPLLDWAYDRTKDDGRRRLHKAILQAMAKAAKNAPLDERWDRFIDFDTEGGQAMPYYGSTESKLRESVLLGVPEPRRSELLLKRLEETSHPERVLRVAHVAADGSVVDATIRRMVERKNLGDSFRETIERIGEPALEALCRHIGLSGGDGRFLESLKNTLSHTMYQRVEAALEKAGVRKETPRDALVRMTSNAAGPKVRAYVLQVHREGYEPKPGTLARSGGKAPGIADADVPKDKQGESLTHLFTLDLDEIPELQEKYAGARALAAFCPEPNSGDRSDELELVPITREAAAALPHDDEDDAGTPIAILPLDVPIGVFQRSDEGELKEIRKMIFNAAGHVLGEPFWIQGDEGGFDFVMQINGGLCDVNLGDSGSLYVFESETIFQCY